MRIMPLVTELLNASLMWVYKSVSTYMVVHVVCLRFSTVMCMTFREIVGRSLVM